MSGTQGGVKNSWGETRGQTCRVCGRRDKFNFDVPDDVWHAVVPREQEGVVCLACFDDFARERGVDYSKAIVTLYFAGDGSCFEFRRVWGAPPLTNGTPD